MLNTFFGWPSCHQLDSQVSQEWLLRSTSKEGPRSSKLSWNLMIHAFHSLGLSNHVTPKHGISASKSWILGIGFVLYDLLFWDPVPNKVGSPRCCNSLFWLIDDRELDISVPKDRRQGEHLWNLGKNQAKKKFTKLMGLGREYSVRYISVSNLRCHVNSKTAGRETGLCSICRTNGGSRGVPRYSKPAQSLWNSGLSYN